MQQGGQVESPILRRVEEKLFRALLLVTRGGGKAKRAEMPPHPDDVGRLGGCIDDLDDAFLRRAHQFARQRLVRVERAKKLG
jgi:hypothetical protein